MGVHGLTSYIEGNRQFFTELKLRNTRLVVDGCSLFFRLYFTTGLDQTRGGDYDEFAKVVQRFFTALSSCNISPFVVLDGGMDETDKKFNTLRERAQSKIHDAHSLSRGCHGSVLPLLTREVFQQVICELGVPLVQCISEADFEIASLAHQWRCPVLSNDSDFYIFDLCGGYLPMAFFEWENVCAKASECYIPARRFTVNRFCSHFNHMNKQMLPLFAVITGNDYTHAKTTEMFFSRVHLPMVQRRRGGQSNPRIEGFLLWLSAFGNPTSALEEVLEILGSKQKGNLRKQLTAGIQDYQLPPTSSLLQLFSNSQLQMYDLKLPVALMSQPEWLLKQITSGRLPPLVLDVLVHRRAMLITQVENIRLPSSHEASLSIRKMIYGLLLLRNATQGNGRGRRGRGRGGMMSRGLMEQAQSLSTTCFVEEYDRLELNLRRSTVEAQLPTHQPQLNLSTLDQEAISVRLKWLLGPLGVMEHMLQLVVPHLHLPVCVTYYWAHSSTPKPSHSLLRCVLLGIVYGELCRRKAMFGDPLHVCASTAGVCQRLERLRINSAQRRGVDLGVAHSLSQLQSCMWAGISLNQLLCFPLPEPQCAWLFSGTLLHGFAAAHRAGHQAESLLAGAPVALQLYSTLIGAVLGGVGRPGDQTWQHMAPPRGAGPCRQRGQGRRQRGDGGRPNRRRGGAPAAGDSCNRFGMLTCDEESDED